MFALSIISRHLNFVGKYVIENLTRERREKRLISPKLSMRKLSRFYPLEKQVKSRSEQCACWCLGTQGAKALAGLVLADIDTVKNAVSDVRTVFAGMVIVILGILIPARCVYIETTPKRHIPIMEHNISAAFLWHRIIMIIISVIMNNGGITIYIIYMHITTFAMFCLCICSSMWVRR